MPRLSDCVVDLRVGINAGSDELRSYVRNTLSRSPVRALLYDASPHNRYKYPVMRRMLYDGDNPITATHVMWFDDDSALVCEDAARWWRQVSGQCRLCVQMGFWRYHRVQLWEVHGVRTRPWYTNRPLVPGKRLPFVLGGWWVADMAALRKLDYPWPELKHNGGDWSLGVALYQQHMPIVKFTEGVLNGVALHDTAVMAPRRGASLPPIFKDWKEGQPPDMSHQDFELKGEILSCGGKGA